MLDGFLLLLLLPFLGPGAAGDRRLQVLHGESLGLKMRGVGQADTREAAGESPRPPRGWEGDTGLGTLAAGVGGVNGGALGSRAAALSLSRPSVRNRGPLPRIHMAGWMRLFFRNSSSLNLPRS